MARGTGEFTVRVEGLPRYMKLVAESEADVEDWLRVGLLALGEKVAKDVRARYAPYSEPGAAGVKAKVRKTGTVVVAQTMRKSRNMNLRRGNFGGLMMRKAFLPAADAAEKEVEAGAEVLFADLERKWDL